jgi:hypothetical protein
VELECDLGREVYLLAVPDGAVSEEQLTNAGVPGDRNAGVPGDRLAVVKGTRLGGPEWCVVEQPVSTGATANRPKVESEVLSTTHCVKSQVAIHRLHVAHSRRVAVVLDLATHGGSLISLTALR